MNFIKEMCEKMNEANEYNTGGSYAKSIIEQNGENCSLINIDTLEGDLNYSDGYSKDDIKELAKSYRDVINAQNEAIELMTKSHKEEMELMAKTNKATTDALNKAIEMLKQANEAISEGYKKVLQENQELKTQIGKRSN